MAIDLYAARQFIESTGRVLERHRLAHLLDGGSVEPVLTALRAYHNADGGFGHALEPDVRTPASQPSAALTALDILAEVGNVKEPMVAAVADWISSISNPDGGVPTVLPSANGHPRAPWMEPNPASGLLTYALAARLWSLDFNHPWLDRATTWCWDQLERMSTPGGYTVKFALMFLDAVPDLERAAAVVDRLRSAISADGAVPVPDGIEDERITPIELSPKPGRPSRALFTDAQIASDLDRLEHTQLPDGGWDFHWLHFSLGQSVEWRGMVTLDAIRVLHGHGRT